MPDLSLNFRLNRASAAPLHRQVSGYLQAMVLSGALAPGSRLPAEPVLAERLGVSRGTLRRATATLIEGGVLVQQHGRGTFVAERGLDVEAPFVSEITSLAQSLTARGVTMSTHVLELVRRPADERSARALGIARGDEVIRLDRVRSDRSGPVMRLVNVMRPDVFDLDDPDRLEDRALYDLFEANGTPPAAAERTIGATVADEDQSRVLGVAVGHPLLHIEQLTTLADGRALEFSDVWICGERLKLQVTVRRTG